MELKLTMVCFQYVCGTEQFRDYAALWKVAAGFSWEIALQQFVVFTNRKRDAPTAHQPDDNASLRPKP